MEYVRIADGSAVSTPFNSHFRNDGRCFQDTVKITQNFVWLEPYKGAGPYAVSEHKRWYDVAPCHAVDGHSGQAIVYYRVYHKMVFPLCVVKNVGHGTTDGRMVVLYRRL